MGCLNTKLQEFKGENQFWANELASYDYGKAIPNISVSSLLGPDNGKVFYQHSVQPEIKQNPKRKAKEKPKYLEAGQAASSLKSKKKMGVIELQDPEDVRETRSASPFFQHETVHFLAEDFATHDESFVPVAATNRPVKNKRRKKGNKKKKQSPTNNAAAMEGEGLWLADDEEFLSSMKALEDNLKRKGLAEVLDSTSPATGIHFAESTWGDIDSPLSNTKDLLDELMADGGYGNPAQPPGLVRAKVRKMNGASPLSNLGTKFPQTASLLRSKGSKRIYDRPQPSPFSDLSAKYPQTVELLRELGVPTDNTQNSTTRKFNQRKRQKMQELLDEYSARLPETPPQSFSSSSSSSSSFSSSSPVLSSFSSAGTRLTKGLSSRARKALETDNISAPSNPAETATQTLEPTASVASSTSSLPKPSSVIPPAPPIPAYLSSNVPAAPPLPPLSKDNNASSKNNSKSGKASHSGRKLKKFHWEAIRGAESGLWAEIGQEVQLPSLDFSDLDAKFGASAPPTQTMKKTPRKWGKKGNKSGKKDPSETEVPSLIEAKRAYNIEITFASFKLSLEELREAILSVDNRVLTTDRLEALAKVAPTAEEIATLNRYNGDLSRHGLADRYVDALKDIPNVQRRLELFHFQSTFPLHASKVEMALDAVAKACLQVKENKNVKDILYVILQIGNRMNSYEAAGFRLSSLGRLTSTKATGTDRNFTLLHFLVTFLKKNFPAALKLSQELDIVKEAAVIEPYFVEEELRQMNRKLKSLENELALSMQGKTSSPAQSLFKDKMPAFVEAARQRYNFVENKYQVVCRLSQELAAYFGEPSLKWNEFFTLWKSFLKNFDMSVKQVEEQEERKERSLRRRASFRTSATTKRKSLPAQDQGTFGVLDEIKALRKDENADEHAAAVSSLLSSCKKPAQPGAKPKGKTKGSSSATSSSRISQVDTTARASPLSQKRFTSADINSPRQHTPRRASQLQPAEKHLASLVSSPASRRTSVANGTPKSVLKSQTFTKANKSSQKRSALWGSLLPMDSPSRSPMRSPRVMR